MLRNNRKGQALLLVMVAMGIFLLGAMGLAIDGAQMYSHRQMAQAAADAAVQAGIFSIFVKTKTTDGTSHTCAAADLTASNSWSTTCRYADRNGFMTADDTVVISYPGTACGAVRCFNGVTGSPNPDYPFPFEQVTITRTFRTSFMQFFGTSTSTVRAIAAAGIVQANSPIPILVMHPTLSGALDLSNNTTITICGGPNRSIHVNSSSSTALSINSALIDLRRAGPLDNIANPCVAGTGADFGIYGGPTTQPGSSVLALGVGKYIQPAAPFSDPLRSVPTPTVPANAPAPTPLADNTGGCPNPPNRPCVMYYPGFYSATLNVQNQTAVFQPGLYYINGDFSNAANGQMYMCQSVGGVTCTNPGLAGNLGTGNGMVVYLNSNNGTIDGNFNVGSNSTATLVGSANNSTYKGILFFEDHNAMNHRGQGANRAHTIGAGAVVNLQGTIYAVNSAARITDTYYQNVRFGGNAGGITTVIGEVIVDAISMTGGGTLTMRLNPANLLPVDQVALIK